MHKRLTVIDRVLVRVYENCASGLDDNFSSFKKSKKNLNLDARVCVYKACVKLYAVSENVVYEHAAHRTPFFREDSTYTPSSHTSDKSVLQKAKLYVPQLVLNVFDKPV